MDSVIFEEIVNSSKWCTQLKTRHEWMKFCGENIENVTDRLTITESVTDSMIVKDMALATVNTLRHTHVHATTYDVPKKKIQVREQKIENMADSMTINGITIDMMIGEDVVVRIWL